MVRPVWEFPVHVPRHAFSSRDTARAGDIWRCLQEVAVEGSTLAGWSPLRYREAKTGFVVRSAVVLHHREPTYGEAITARTWVSSVRRDIFTTRQIRLRSERGPVASGTQEWAHITQDLKPLRADATVTACFPEHQEDPSVELPAWTESGDIRSRSIEVRVWHTWMDPLAHANHPAYVDWTDEALSEVLAAAGIHPVLLAPVAEKVMFRAGVVAPDRVTVATHMAGRTALGALVFQHRFLRNEGELCATATTVRTLVGGDAEPLAAAFAKAVQ